MLEKDFKHAIKNYIDTNDAIEPYSIRELLTEGPLRDDVFFLADAVKELYGFRILDIEAYIVWEWYSLDWDAGWLGLSKDPKETTWVFDEFVKRYGVKIDN